MKMMRAVTVFVALCCAGSVVADARAEVTPVQKVLDLMDGMLAKGKEEKHIEQTQFAAYKQFCDDTSAAKGAAIDETKATIAILKADIAKNTATAAELAQQIAGHEEDISVFKGDIAAATKVRKIEKVEFDKMHADYSESIDALERAIAVLKKQAYDRKQAPTTSLAQVEALKKLALIPKSARRAIDAFLSEEVSEEDLDKAPEANAYEFQSTGVIDMLEKLLDKFSDERTTLEKEEMNSRHAYEMLMQDLSSQKDAATKSRTEKAGAAAKAKQDRANSEGDLQETTATMKEDKKYLADLTASCGTKASDFESRQQLRAEELETIEKAIEILSGDTVKGAGEKYLPSLVQKKGVQALAQLRAGATNPLQQRAAMYLQNQADALHSKVLKALAAHAEADPFTKVKKMIKDLIVKLMDEANEEAEHKGWCDTEMATNAKTRAEKTAAVEQLNAEIDELTASIAKCAADIAELTAAVAALDAAMAKATAMRAEEKEKNEQTVKDAEEAQAAVSQALTVLKEFYAKAAEATSFVQKAGQAPPPIFEGPYKGMQAENGGVIGMLEVIQSDFARLESDTKASEASALKEYEEFMEDSTIDKTAKTTDINFKTTKKSDESSALVSKKDDLTNTQEELDSALVYYDKLKPSCVDADVSYSDRTARREQEIASLQEALKILNGEA
mmetsp:Transcript_157600/g.273439  ORF Transcript_157600/g.273439 Transcript_157600/m.273439 type:complete len:676 (+) Transcript_157600:43-2070(+)